MVVLRSHAGSIVEEVLPELEILSGSEVTLLVHGGPFGYLFENALLAALQRRGVSVVLPRHGTPQAPTIEVFIIAQAVGYSSALENGWNRTIVTSCEVRTRAARGEEARYVGMFDRNNVDLVADKEDLHSATKGEIAGSSSAFDRILTPVLVIAGAVLVVFLFFTVRS
jgi:hypothetical protein